MALSRSAARAENHQLFPFQESWTHSSAPQGPETCSGKIELTPPCPPFPPTMSSPISRDGWSAAAGWTVARAATLIQPNICLFQVDLPELFDQPGNLLPLSKSTKTSSYIYFQQPSLYHFIYQDSFILPRERKTCPGALGHIRDFVGGATLVQDEDRLRPKVASCWRNNGNFLLLLLLRMSRHCPDTSWVASQSQDFFGLLYCTASQRILMPYNVLWRMAM